MAMENNNDEINSVHVETQRTPQQHIDPQGKVPVKNILRALRNGDKVPSKDLRNVVVDRPVPQEEEKVIIHMGDSPLQFKEEEKSLPEQAIRPEPEDEKQPITENQIVEEEKEDVIKIENAHKTYLLGLEGVAALRGVSLTIKKKEFVCIFGTSGGGKTTLLNIIGTIDKPTKGNVYVDGLRVRNSTADKDLASLRLNKLSFVFQTFNLISSLTALENVELPMQLKGEFSRTEIRNRAVELLTKVGLGERIGHFPRQLSGGEQQRVTIARALANKPEIMLLDEPTGDLDTKNTDLVMKILMDLNKEGITMVMVSHDLNLKNYAHRVIRVADGKAVGEEIIDPKVRKKHVADLYERVNNPRKEKLSIREGADYSQSKDGKSLEQELIERFPVKLSKTTSVRMEGDYKIIRFAMENRGEGGAKFIEQALFIHAYI
eukprot:TRINITY_DN2095_c0_g1_i1.p8 TRINITY_DN2095_c0_g1~~TRINITY_DN2095_c0_g1_i1.p8  ORF type:complete len:433 (-),score=63.53 TRINITY_DN2095_c0_g1_i1:9673-10971(-)